MWVCRTPAHTQSRRLFFCPLHLLWVSARRTARCPKDTGGRPALEQRIAIHSLKKNKGLFQISGLEDECLCCVFVRPVSAQDLPVGSLIATSVFVLLVFLVFFSKIVLDDIM